MTEVFIKYNPYTVETIIRVDGKELAEDSYLSKYKNDRLQIWVENLIPEIINQLNESEIKLVFNGSKLDYEDVLYYCNYYNENGYNGDEVDIKLEHIPSNESSQKIRQLKELVQDMKKGPFEELRSEQIEKNFNKAINSEFEIAVIATMSSGKSTLINSMLSQELMPAKITACTAQITRIKDNNDLDSFRAECRDIDEQVVLTMENVSNEQMKEFNEDDQIAFIDIEGNIPNISSEEMKLVLIDTPGPNSSQNISHKQFTFKVIKDESTKPMVLYVLNATQLSTNDDNSLLEQVAQAMKVGGKQSKDRFIFAVNKIDEVDTETEDINDMLNTIKLYLENHGIENPNIYPVSSELAKLIRLQKKGYNLTKKQKSFLESGRLFLGEEDLHTLKYTPLSENTKKELQQKINNCQEDYEKVLYHTGIPYIETAINIYLKKYAVTSKITAAVNSFKKIIEEKQMFEKIEDEIKENEEYKNSIIEQIDYLNEQLKQGNGAKKVKEEIDKLTFDKNDKSYATKATRTKIDIKINSISNRFRHNKQITEYEANAIINKLQQDLKDIDADIKTDLYNTMNQVIRLKAEEYIERYKKQVEGLIKTDSKLSAIGIEYLSYSIPDTDEIIDKYKYVQQEKVGEEIYKNPFRKIYKPWTLFTEPKYLTRNIYENRTYIDGNQLSETILDPYKKNLEDNLEKLENSIDVEINNLKEFFKNELDKLENILENKVNKLKDLARKSDNISSNIQTKNAQKEWLLEISNRLEKILDI